MYHILLIAEETPETRKLITDLEREGFRVTSLDPRRKQDLPPLPEALDCVLVASSSEGVRVYQGMREQAEVTAIPSILLIAEGELQRLEPPLPFDDFLVMPLRPSELHARIELALQRRGRLDGRNVLRFNDLVIDMEKYEVTLAGQVVDLTYKEYELLKLLATHKERVFTRETLLNRVWGYDYYGGVRTVDVHIRRLRSKIEDATHSFIDTVRGVGYRFRAK